MLIEVGYEYADADEDTDMIQSKNKMSFSIFVVGHTYGRKVQILLMKRIYLNA